MQDNIKISSEMTRKTQHREEKGSSHQKQILTNMVTETSKKIKKEKKKKKSGRSISKQKNTASQFSGGRQVTDNIKEENKRAMLEEGEEEELNEDGIMTLVDIPFDLNEKPQNLLLEKFERFPLYLEISVENNPYFFEFQQVFS